MYMCISQSVNLEVNLEVTVGAHMYILVYTSVQLQPNQPLCAYTCMYLLSVQWSTCICHRLEKCRYMRVRPLHLGHSRILSPVVVCTSCRRLVRLCVWWLFPCRDPRAHVSTSSTKPDLWLWFACTYTRFTHVHVHVHVTQSCNSFLISNIAIL